MYKKNSFDNIYKSIQSGREFQVISKIFADHNFVENLIFLFDPEIDCIVWDYLFKDIIEMKNSWIKSQYINSNTFAIKMILSLNS